MKGFPSFQAKGQSMASSSIFTSSAHQKGMGTSRDPVSFKTSGSSNNLLEQQNYQNGGQNGLLMTSKSSIFTNKSQQKTFGNGFALSSMAKKIQVKDQQQSLNFKAKNPFSKSEVKKRPEGQSLNIPFHVKKSHSNVDSKKLNTEPSVPQFLKKYQIKNEVSPNIEVKNQNKMENQQFSSHQQYQECNFSINVIPNSIKQNVQQNIVKTFTPPPKKLDFFRKRKQSFNQETHLVQNKSQKVFNNFQSKDSHHSNSKNHHSTFPIQDKNANNFLKFNKSNQSNQRISPGKFTNQNSPNLNFEFKKIKEQQIKQPKQSKETFHFLKSKKSSSVVARNFSLDDFQLVEKLGKGAFGDVFFAIEKKIQFACVIKKMSKKRIKDANIDLCRQIKLQSYLNHAHLTSLYGFFDDEDYIYLILELLPDNSLQQLKKKRKVSQKQTADIISQVSEGLNYMHEEYVIHRDIKMQNLFVNQGYVKLGDFGCSIFHKDNSLRNTVIGSLTYFSPEQLNQEGYTEKVDSWSLGILTYELLFATSPFQQDLKKMRSNGQFTGQLSEIVYPLETPISNTAKDFITKLLLSDVDERMGVDQAIHHPFLKNTQNYKMNV